MHRTFSLIVVVALLVGVGCGEGRPPASGDDFNARQRDELVSLIDGSKWSWYRGEKNGGQTFEFADGTYRLSDWPEGRGAYVVVDGYTIDLTDPNGVRAEMIVSRNGTHFFLVDAKGGVRWGKRQSQ